jgi:hypothetical protein
MHGFKWLKHQTLTRKSRRTPVRKALPFSEEQIRAKAYEVWQERMARGRTAQDDWQMAIQRLHQERARRWQKPIRRMLSWLNQPLIWVEKSVMEPFADWFERAAIFKIVEKLPVLEAVGVLLIPVVIWWFSQSYQAEKDRQERAIRQQEAIKTYLNQLTTVFLDGDINKNPDLQRVTRASTLALLQDPNLNGIGKGQVITFLYEIGLISVEPKGQSKQTYQKTVISLSRADLSHIELQNVDLKGINLSEANFSFGKFSGSFRGANLKNANLNHTDLFTVDLRDADLRGAILIGANLEGVNLRSADLRNAIFSPTIELFVSDHPLVYSRESKLDNTDFSGANLEGASITDEQLRQADLCQTTLPDGKKSDRDCVELKQRRSSPNML